MTRVVRFMATAMLVLATAVMTPLTFLWCEDGCDDIVQAKTTTAPACHHVTTTGQHFGTTPQACGHDHTAFVALRPVGQDTGSSMSDRPSVAIVPVSVTFQPLSHAQTTAVTARQPNTSPHLIASPVLRI